jgi:hypothetical protein
MKNQEIRDLVRVKLPSRVGVSSIANLIEISNQIMTTAGDVELDCSEVHFFDPFGMTLLVALLESIDDKREVSMPWLSLGIASYLDRMDFFSRLNIQGVEVPANRARSDLQGTLLEITMVRNGESSEQIADRLATAVVGKIVGRGPEPVDFDKPESEFDRYYKPIRYALSELIENALTHARRDGHHDASVWIASQYYNYAQGGMVQIAVVDNGCGFLATLRNHAEVREPTHASAILAALKPRVSCNRDLGPYGESVNQGVGLTTTARIAKATGGDIHIVSGDALVRENNNPATKRRDRSVSLPAAWNGVAISATFDRAMLPNIRISDLLPKDGIDQPGSPQKVNLNFID